MNDSELAPNLDAILADLLPAARRLAARRRARARSLRLASVAAGGLLLASSAAVAGFAIIGSPAPSAVKRDIRNVDRGMPRDLRLNPDVDHAQAVAASHDSVVYFAALKDGGYCAELVTADAGPRGAVCATRSEVDRTPLGVTIPFSEPVTETSPVTVSGHVSVAEARTVELVYPDGGSDAFAIGARRFYVAEVPAAHLPAVHRRGLVLIARDGNGKALAQAVVPTDAITPPTEAERPHDPIELDTVSTEADFTEALRVRGALYVDGVDRVTLRYPDGTTVAMPLSGHRFDYVLPADRRHDLMTPGTVTALSASGHVLAERPVAAVAYWHARER
jgi:hypothetical protein